MEVLRSGVKVDKVFWADGQTLQSGYPGEMVITEENGQGASVPWIKQTMDDGRVYMHNCAMVETILLERGE